MRGQFPLSGKNKLEKDSLHLQEVQGPLGRVHFGKRQLFRKLETAAASQM